ncbi:acetyl/propionyl/methylcrotonyl-CoA carboxylase subunit alpha [Humibacter ginsenosidimutans]|uniref:biotin carboxylase n=1 Tax=Humibacter ginsenosidimutans TaxID=2599293 RepID=A0A5B8LZB9_9MICO|nr:biotin carboxylase N-terminal domain-containing protein [Humibacter ginsenosidimutans]QDZ13493.1 ATP-grasp domain-containing protein [Humibacter ginsenosidimutans]
MTMFTTVLVANRGEIARRVIRTLRAMGIRSVAVYSDADAGARHVREADEAVRIGPADAASSYLNIAAVLEAARRTGAQAVHPGYGFLSENADFARACADAGIAFIGPPPQAIESMGDKVRAKRLVAEHGVPVNAGVDDRDLDDAALAAAAEQLGFPVLVKPSAGGGGMGMVEVREASELPAALRTARRVATAAFGDDALFLERLIDTPRHIEVQVLADKQGTVVHLGERECSLQRRHQKVIEECPSPAVDDALRARMGEAACAVARSVGYTGVGTVEFLVSARDPGTFSFMEMNTRLQVEHPVTELVCGVGDVRGIDLVEQQLRVAAGEPLTFAQDDVRLTGHAVEARLYAEDPAHDFLPATGRVLALREPRGDGVRVDSALETGLTITGDYDPMLAKVIAWGTDRDEALARLSDALGRTTVLGVVTNAAFLRALVDDADVRAARIDTGLIARLLERDAEAAVDDTTGGGNLPPADALTAAALLVNDDEWRRGSDAPWSRPTGWRLGTPSPVERRFGVGRTELVVRSVGAPADAVVRIGDGDAVRSRLLERSGDRMLVERDSRAARFLHARDADTLWLARDDGASAEPGPWVLRLLPSARPAAERGAARGASDAAADPQVRSPMPGTIVSVEVADGDAVEAGAGILVIEAMKMEHRVVAPLAGTVRLTSRVGDHVAADQPLALIEPVVPTRDDETAAPTTGGPTAADDRRPIPTTETRP